MFDLAPSPETPRFALSPYDETVIGGASYKVIDTSERGHLFIRIGMQPSDAAVVPFELSHDDIAQRIGAGQMMVNRDRYLPEEFRRRLRGEAELFSTLDEEVKERARRRHSVVVATEDMLAEGKLKMTDAAINAALPEIEERARVIYRGDLMKRRKHVGGKPVPVMKPSARTVRAWLKAYDRDGLNGLVDQRARSGRKAAGMAPEARSLMMAQVRRYASPNKPSKAQIRADVQRAFKSENERRDAVGLPPLMLPKRHVIDAAIDSLDAFHVAVARDGYEAACRRRAPVGEGPQPTRPLERVEIDEWQIDLVALLCDMGLYNDSLKADFERLGLLRETKRFWLTVAICATTRVILAMKLSVNPKASAAVQTVNMMLRDKQVFADAVGALSPWNMYGAPEHVVTDCGAAFQSTEFCATMMDLGISFERTPAGIPHLRGRIERMFRTIGDQLMARLSGRTFGDLATRGDHDPTTRAALTVDELCFALVRWVVDIYHNRPHEGLGGETPLNAWKRLTKLYGVRPSPDLRRQRLVFGAQRTLKADREGVSVFGVRYHSERLARWVSENSATEVEVRWHADDIGAVMVRLDKEWIEVPSVQRRFAGVSAQVWAMATRQLRATRKAEAEFAEDIVFRAIDDIEALNGAAMRRRGVVTDEWTPEAIQRAEDGLFVGFRIRTNDAPAQALSAAPRGLGRALPTAASVSVKPAASDGARSPEPAPAISVVAETDAVPRHPQPASAVAALGADDDFGFEEK